MILCQIVPYYQLAFGAPTEENCVLGLYYGRFFDWKKKKSNNVISPKIWIIFGYLLATSHRNKNFDDMIAILFSNEMCDPVYM